MSPDPGATTSSHPVFTWALGPGEESDSVHIANQPDTTPDGEFHSENVVAIGNAEPDSTTWSPTDPLFAGRYWWNVETRDADFAPSFSPVRDFTVATEIRLLSVRFARYTVGRHVRIDLRWVTNAHDVVVEVRFLRRGRTVGLVRRQGETLISRDPDSAVLTWTAPRKVGRRSGLVAVVRVTGAGASATTRRSFTAP